MQYTYNTLLASCQNYCIDNSIITDTQSYIVEFPNLVQLSEMRIIKDLQLSVFDLSTTGVMVIGNNSIAKPTDMITIRDIYVVVGGNNIHLQLRSKSYLDAYWPNATNTEQPVYYADNSTTTWQVTPTPNQTYTYQVNYIARPVPMSAANQTTWIGTKLGEVMLYATLIESALYFREDPVTQSAITQFWEKAYEEVVTQARDELAPFVSATNNSLTKLSKTT